MGAVGGTVGVLANVLECVPFVFHMTHEQRDDNGDDDNDEEEEDVLPVAFDKERRWRGRGRRVNVYSTLALKMPVIMWALRKASALVTPPPQLRRRGGSSILAEL